MMRQGSYPHAMILGWLLAFAGWAAGAQPRGEIPGLRPMLVAHGQAVEHALAARLLRRPDAPADKLERLEMEIDLRILSRFVIAQALAARPGSEAQVNAALRAKALVDATAAVEQAMAKQEKLTVAQEVALRSLHELTFGLESVKTAAGVDEVCKQAGVQVMALGAPEMGGRPVPLVRPRAIPRSPSPRSSASVPADTMELIEQSKRLNVSAALRRQMMLLGAQASRESNGIPERARDIAACRALLEDVVQLADGLQSNAAASAEQRLSMEADLAAGIALFLDPRTRSAGEARIAPLRQYGQFAMRVGRLGFSAELQSQLSGALAWSRSNGEHGAKALAAIEQYAKALRALAERSKAPAVGPALKKAADDADRLVAQSSAAFIAAAGELPRAGASRVDELQARAAVLERFVSLRVQIDRMPWLVDALSAYRPAAKAALEKRLASVAATAAGAEDTLPRREALKLLDDAFTLADRAAAMPRMVPSGLPASIERRWTGGHLESLESHWKQIAGDIVAAIAAGQPVDPAKLDRIPQAAALYEAFKAGAAMDLALAGAAEPISRWVDWRISVAELRPVLLPCPQALAAAMQAYGRDGGDFERWQRTDRLYRPIVEYLTYLAGYGEACADYPGGVAGIAAGLMAPLEGAPFARERFAALAILAWNASEKAGRSADADAVLQMLSKKLEEE